MHSLNLMEFEVEFQSAILSLIIFFSGSDAIRTYPRYAFYKFVDQICDPVEVKILGTRIG